MESICMAVVVGNYFTKEYSIQGVKEFLATIGNGK